MARIDPKALLSGWADSAARMDEFVTVSDLLEAAAQGAADDDLLVARARAAVLAGRPALAAGLLADVDRDVLDADEHTWKDVVAMAAWAADGDHDALAALVRLGHGLPGPQAVAHAYLLARAAEQIGQHDLADGVWRALSETDSPTMLVQRRARVAAVLHRSTTDDGDAGAAVGTAARSLADMVPMPEDDLRPTRDVVERLEARGDADGAWLVLEALSRLRPGATGVRAMLAERAPTHPRWRVVGLRVLAAAGAVAVAAYCIAAGIDALLPSVAVVAASSAWLHSPTPREKALNGADAKVLKDVRGIGPDVGTRFSGLRQLVLGLGGLVLGFIFSVIAIAIAIEEGPWYPYFVDNPATADGIAWPLATMFGLLGGAGGARLGRRVLERESARWVDRLREDSVKHTRECVCVAAVGMRGVETERYLAQHLVEASPEIAGLTPAIADSDLTSHQCPISRTPWLAVRTPGREALLVKGVLAKVKESEEPAGGYL
ncbi:hypothetical protein [Cellulomonas sp. SLBN-39]|uniref:hypothetical protein n=1 Tax=Cellulomonas sp. SLBN-39 TaxID=2768446 RepID=UPI001154E0A5|nr:hypothetical protein [Cellulomonas sp. SLBN-39]TQL02294.1 hypothetical protein FBY24_1368 [Cellulomonas sp. SLBN-39]